MAAPAIAIRHLLPGDDDTFAAAVAIYRAVDAELTPDDPPVPAEELHGQLFTSSVDKRLASWVATIGLEPAGVLTASLPLDDDNRTLAVVEDLEVVPDQRRRGVAWALLQAVLPHLVDDGRASLVIDTRSDAGVALCQRLGLTARQEERISRLRIADLDPAQQEEWARGEPAAAAGYRLVQIGDHCPEELVEAYLTAKISMGDVPLGDLDYTVPQWDADVLRSREARWQQQRVSCARTLALAPDGSGAGLSEIFIGLDRPTMGWQGDTGVRAEHRGRRIGRWLKAVNLADARRLEPRLAVVETGNAQSNRWMLAINEAMGFRPHHVVTAFQGDLPKALEVVSAP